MALVGWTEGQSVTVLWGASADSEGGREMGVKLGWWEGLWPSSRYKRRGQCQTASWSSLWDDCVKCWAVVNIKTTSHSLYYVPDSSRDNAELWRWHPLWVFSLCWHNMSVDQKSVEYWFDVIWYQPLKVLNDYGCAVSGWMECLSWVF